MTSRGQKAFELGRYHIWPCIMHSYIFLGLIHKIVIPLLYPWYVTITPMYNVYPYFYLKNLGKTVHIIHGKIQYFLKIGSTV